MTLPKLVIRDTHPLAVLSACKRAAIRERWLLEEWVTFSADVRACLTPEAKPEEEEEMWRVVREKFDVMDKGGQSDEG